MNTSENVMYYLIKFEELLLLGLALFLFSRLDYGWGTYALLFFAPDLSMLGYLANPRIGAWTYNLAHHKALAVALYVLGSIFSVPWLIFAGTILLGHSSLDRVFGYGLKYPDAFQNTHLGVIGKYAAKGSRTGEPANG
ncbi:MAG: DUF4260 domain-containing protein [Chloroflexota bacterium]